MKIDLYGRDIEVIRRSASRGEYWQVCHLGGEGKKRPAPEIVIPETVDLEDVLDYLSDIYHEDASEERPSARLIGD